MKVIEKVWGFKITAKELKKIRQEIKGEFAESKKGKKGGKKKQKQRESSSEEERKEKQSLRSPRLDTDEEEKKAVFCALCKRALQEEAYSFGKYQLHKKCLK